jgi:UDP-N-acetylmuramyl pentapeptide phosphotransferase/UDP-N-acetylglucosamine-1-phosphate transferase
MLFFLLLLCFTGIALIYFRVADYFNIIDKPNERSSHTQITIRGGGILFPLAWILYSLTHGVLLPWASLGLLAISIVSFADDRMALSSRLRFGVHLLAFTCCFIELNLFYALPWWVIPIVYIIGIGCVNAVNFMDGINGMTGLYSLSVLIPIQWALFGTLWNGSLLNYLMVSLLVFGFFNFRKKARCFAGDVGSVSMGYILVFLLLGFIFNRFAVNHQSVTIGIQPVNFSVSIQYLLLLSLYGVDAILTLVQRLYLRENIFEAHRRHFYQLLCNEYRLGHISVSLAYALVQLVINIYVLKNKVSWITMISFLLSFSVAYGLVKFLLLKRSVSR